MFRFDRRLFANFDWVFVSATLIVILIGLANLYSATYLTTQHGTTVFIKQLYYLLMGFGLILFIISQDYRKLLFWNYLLYIILILLLVSALWFGKTVGGSQRWIDLGVFNLQPSEPAKLMLVIALASYYSRKDTGQGFSLKQLFIPFTLTLIPFLLIFEQPDLGTALMLVFIFISITLFVKLTTLSLLSIIGGALAILPIAWFYILKDYQRQRVLTLFQPESDPLGSGWQIIQSKIAVGSGRIFGKGYLEGTQTHLDFLPERHTDFAFSVLAEEWGFIGSIFFLACYCFLILWGLNIAVSARNKFGLLLAFGITALFFWQAFINLSMVIGLLPVVGMPLPLFSYGGSSLLTSLAGIGILLNIRMRRYMTPS